jgi:hypothetical protein
MTKFQNTILVLSTLLIYSATAQERIKFVPPVVFDENYFCDGWALIKKGGKCGFIDRQPDPIPETVPEETDTTPEEDDRRTTTTITIEDIPPTRIDNTRNANLEATRQRAEFEKDKILQRMKKRKIKKKQTNKINKPKRKNKETTNKSFRET